MTVRYKIRRISLGSALRVSLLLGWLIAICPAVCLAGVVVRVLQGISRAFGRVEPFEITVFDQPIARIDVLQILRLEATAGVVDQLVQSPPRTFLLLTLLLTLLGAAVLLVVTLLFGVGYNLLAALSGGLSVELREE